jgi:hypothetical protein
MYTLVMEEKTDTHFLGGSRSGSSFLLEGYYSVQFSINNKSPSYIFKLHNTSLNRLCIVVKDDSFVFKQLQIGDILNMEYNQPGTPDSSKSLKTKITSKIAHDHFAGHSLVGLSVMDKQDENL